MRGGSGDGAVDGTQDDAADDGTLDAALNKACDEEEAKREWDGWDGVRMNKKSVSRV